MVPNFSSPLAPLRHLFLIVALSAASFFAFPTVRAQDTATATLTSGGANSITIGANGAFNLTLGITFNFPSSGYTVFYQSNNGQGLFQINSRTLLDPFFNQAGNPSFPQILNPSNMGDLGAMVTDIGNPHPPGTFTLQSVNISARNAPVGVYTIFLDSRSIMTSRTGGGFTDVNIGGSSGPVFTVNVVPEPSTIGLFGIGAAALGAMVWRRRRAAASSV